MLRIDSRREIAVEVGRGGWILDIVSSIGFADDLHVGCERKRDIKGDSHTLA